MVSRIINADSAQWIIRQAVENGLPASSLLAETGLAPDWIHKKEGVITFPQYCRLVLNLLDESRDPGIGFKFPKQIKITDFGFLGYAFMSCQTLKEALAIGSKFWELGGQLLKNTIQTDDDHLTLAAYPASHFVNGRVLVYAVEEAFVSTIAAASSVINTPLQVSKIHFSYPAPEHQGVYQREFNCPLCFDRDENKIFIETKFLDQPISTANPDVAALVKKQCETLLLSLQQSDSFVEGVRRVLLKSPGNFPDSTETAKLMGLSRSSFFRRLKEKNTSFQSILDEIRTEIAMKYLCETGLSIDRISDLIGFSEPTTFRSAFKRWTGQSASKFRKKYHSG